MGPDLIKISGNCFASGLLGHVQVSASGARDWHSIWRSQSNIKGIFTKIR
jgi:hypothetical protein